MMPLTRRLGILAKLRDQIMTLKESKAATAGAKVKRSDLDETGKPTLPH
jgi:hypothetical protein